MNGSGGGGGNNRTSSSNSTTTKTTDKVLAGPDLISPNTLEKVVPLPPLSEIALVKLGELSNSLLLFLYLSNEDHLIHFRKK